jgi:hypothetical protein
VAGKRGLIEGKWRIKYFRLKFYEILAEKLHSLREVAASDLQRAPVEEY